VKNRLRFLLRSSALSLGVTLAYAHHGPYGQFDLDHRFDFTGTVVAVEWTNPHAFVLVQASVDGNENVFRIELRNLQQLRDRGWNGKELQAGQPVRVINAALEIAAQPTLVCCARIYDMNGKEFYTDPRPDQSSANSGS